MKYSDNVEQVVKKRLCLGCGLCDGICPEGAIAMQYSSKNRTYIPSIDSVKCNECGICLKACPGIHINFRIDNGLKTIFGSNSSKLGGCLKCYIAHSTDPEIRRNAASGGIATALSLYLLRSGKIDAVAATVIKEGNSVETAPLLCKSEEQVLKSMGSKYCPTTVNSIIKDIDSNSVKSLMLVGLPCQVQGICNAGKIKPLKKMSPLLTIGLLCGGMRGREATGWIFRKNRIKMNSVTEIKAHRGEGWPGNLLYRIGNESGYRKIPYAVYPDEFFESWQPWRCWLCLDRTAQAADITIGDAWLKELKEDREGSSIIIARTDKGVELIEGAIRHGFISGYEVQHEKALESQPGLWWEIEHKVRAYLQLAGFLKLSMPQYDIQLEKPGLRDAVGGMKRILRMALLRKISASDFLYACYAFAQNIRQRI